MFHSAYLETCSETTSKIRDNERAAFDKAIGLLELAQAKGADASQSAEALHYVTRLWRVLLEDLAEEGNGLPKELKASLISIGIWVLKRAEDIRQGKSGDFSALIEVCRSIRSGLGRD